MVSLHFDSTMSNAERRNRLFAGDLFICSPRPSALALIIFARSLIENAFAPSDPQTAQPYVPVERFVEIFGPLKPGFIHHPKSIELLREVVADLGCDLDETYIDVPRLRGVTNDNYVTAGVGYAFPAHRDTWWSAPLAQVNWWIPTYDFVSESSMAFHPNYWSTPISNGSEEFNYYRYNATGRKDAAKHIKSDTRSQPGPREPMVLAATAYRLPGGRRNPVLRGADALNGAEHIGAYEVQSRLPHSEPIRPGARARRAEC
ncbi:MAG: hypothetical protein L0Z50_36305 [Verrucomicrobiales bacterium]|nr:hypothetical protein [Verrucomicrobiales bacterium]